VRRQVNVCSAHSAIPALGCPLSKRCCSCAGIVLQNGCQVANRVTDFCSESFIHGITSETSRQRAGRVFALENIKCFDFNTRGYFLQLLFGISSPSSPSPTIFPVTRRTARKARYITYTYIHTYVYTCMRTLIHRYIHICIHKYVR
jgi:hypothetical protein